MDRIDVANYQAKIKVIGVGGGGCNAITHMVQKEIRGVDFVAVNSDAQHLSLTETKNRIQIGPKLTRGLGVGGDVEMGRRAAEESREELLSAAKETDMVFITAGMGGGTGTGAAPAIAELAKQSKALLIAIVTRPFTFEGRVRTAKAEQGIANLAQHVDTLITVPNDRLLTICDYKVSVNEAFMMANDVLYNGVKAISELITVPGIINLDFADVKAIMSNAGLAWMAIGRGSGPNRASDAAKAAISSPLLDTTIDGAKGVLLNITGDNSLTMSEVHEAAEIIGKAVDPDANIIFGVAHDPGITDDVKITLIATGFPAGKQTGAPKEEEIRQKLAALKEEDKLDIPAFIRHPMAQKRRQPITIPSEVRAKLAKEVAAKK
ncbi:MAG: Cell division protein FtsZ [Dehalococcoidia bacterium]|nr:Cell division protein FtsZ [Chloroflexota bacterium]